MPTGGRTSAIDVSIKLYRNFPHPVRYMETFGRHLWIWFRECFAAYIRFRFRRGVKLFLYRSLLPFPVDTCSNLPFVRLEVRYPYLKSVGSDPTFPWWLSLCVVTHALTLREKLPFLAYDLSDHTLSPHSISGVYINPCIRIPCSLWSVTDLFILYWPKSNKKETHQHLNWFESLIIIGTNVAWKHHSHAVNKHY